MSDSKKSSTAIKRLTPNAIDVKIDGKDVRVATSRDENAILNMVMASQLRTLLQEQIKKYNEDDNKLTPKELADLAKAGRDIASFSAEVYASSEPINDKPAEKAAEKEDGIPDFSKIGKPIDVKTHEQPSGANTDSTKPSADVPEEDSGPS